MGSDARSPAAGRVTASVVAHEASSALQLRPAASADVPALVAIERASFSDPWNATSFRALLEAEAAHVTVAVLDGAVVGYSAVLRAADEAELANLAVASAAQRRGIGRALLSAAQTVAASTGVAAMYLEVRESNAPARRLYEALGFATVGRRRAYYRQPDEDALVMQWRSEGRDGPSAGS